MKLHCDMEPPPQSVYHSVYVPLEDDSADDRGDTFFYGFYAFVIKFSLYLPVMFSGTKLHIYCDKSEALKVIKKHKQARLKSFKTLEEAQEFSRNGLESVLSNPLAHAVPLIEVSEEKSSNFKAPKPQVMVQFRKLIEKGDLQSVKTTIWENPRFLVSSGDTPAILQVSII